jgi:hypothetical protein
VTFTHYDLGFFDQEVGRVECAQDPFERSVTYVSGMNGYPCARNAPEINRRREGICPVLAVPIRIRVR